MSRFMKLVAACGAGSLLLLSVGQWAHAQTPAQMEYERQQREYRQQQEQQRQDQQRLQQLQNDNARRQQEETNRSVKNSVGVMKTSSAGKAQLVGLPSGTYYVFGANVLNAQPLIWNVKTDLGPGTGSVTLDRRNAVSMN